MQIRSRTSRIRAGCRRCISEERRWIAPLCGIVGSAADRIKWPNGDQAGIENVEGPINASSAPVFSRRPVDLAIIGSVDVFPQLHSSAAPAPSSSLQSFRLKLTSAETSFYFLSSAGQLRITVTGVVVASDTVPTL